MLWIYQNNVCLKLYSPTVIIWELKITSWSLSILSHSKCSEFKLRKNKTEQKTHPTGSTKCQSKCPLTFANWSSYPRRSHLWRHWTPRCTVGCDSHTWGRSGCPLAVFPAAPERSDRRHRGNLSLSSVWKGRESCLWTGDSLLPCSQ